MITALGNVCYLICGQFGIWIAPVTTVAGFVHLWSRLHSTEFYCTLLKRGLWRCWSIQKRYRLLQQYFAINELTRRPVDILIDLPQPLFSLFNDSLYFGFFFCLAIVLFEEVEDSAATFSFLLDLTLRETACLESFNFIQFLLDSRAHLKHRIVIFFESRLLQDLSEKRWHVLVHLSGLVLHREGQPLRIALQEVSSWDFKITTSAALSLSLLLLLLWSFSFWLNGNTWFINFLSPIRCLCPSLLVSEPNHLASGIVSFDESFDSRVEIRNRLCPLIPPLNKIVWRQHIHLKILAIEYIDPSTEASPGLVPHR